ncbi:MAG: pyridoxal-phosphate dependent enzyme [Actinomycetota bacterium]
MSEQDFAPGARNAVAPRELFRRFPELRARIPWVPLADLPTPVERMARLEESLPGDARLFVKRDDLTNSGYGGNKVRKFEFVLAQAVASGATHVVTAGGWGSHHVLATAFFARRFGLATRAYVFPQPFNDHVGRQLLAMAACGAELVPCAGPSVAFARLAVARARRNAPFVIAPGGSTVAGMLGYVEAGLEIAAQVTRDELPPPDAIVTALGSGGTAAGLAVGLALAGLAAEVIAVRITSPVAANARYVDLLCRRVLRCLNSVVHTDLRPSVRVLGGYLGKGYGFPTAAGVAATRRARDTEGLRLEPSYTAKAMAAFTDVASRSASRGKTYMFLDTFSSSPLDSLVRAASPADLPPALRALFARA